MIDFESKLAQTRNNLQELGNAISNLINSTAHLFENPEINSRINEFQRIYQEAVARIEKPVFCLATVGTTSSGKSTIVNALIGRKIAPMEAGEMSGGVLTIKHSEDTRLIVSTTQEGVWDAGEWSGHDVDFYERIQGLMHRYHEYRKKQECVAPDITAFVPLLPVCNSSFLNLPLGVEIEFIDLPGLKSVLDRTNLEIIQKKVDKAFSLVALDYMQVDDEQRKKLLEELQRVVKYFGGNTDSMIFILNRVDLKGADDLPIEDRLGKLQMEIQEVLSLSEPPDILPFNARLLYYAQCAWGTGSTQEASKVEPKIRTKLLDAMFQDCAGTIKLNTKSNKDLRNKFRNIEEQVDDGKDIDDQTMREILDHALEWSGGNKLWDKLQQRVKESFSELVLFPALIELFQTHDALEKALDIILQTRKIDNLEDVEKERQRITEIRKSLQENGGKICQDFQNEIKQYIEALKTNDPDLIGKAIEAAKKKGRKGFQVIFNTVNEIEGEITQLLIAPVRDALKNNQGVFELQEKLEEVISPALAKDVARQYDNVSRRLRNFTSRSGCLVRRVREDDKRAMKELEHDERYVRLLYMNMREALSARAEFSLQAKVKEFIMALESLVDDQVTRLKYSLPDKELSSLNIEQAVMTDLRKKLSENLPTLPDKFFEINPKIDIGVKKETEKIGKETVRVSRKVGGCCKHTEYHDVIKDKMGKVKYKELLLPDIDTMAKQWLSGLGEGRGKLWTILSDWITKRLNDANSMFEESVQEIINLAEGSLQEQLLILEGKEQEEKHWKEFESQKDTVTKFIEALKQN